MNLSHFFLLLSSLLYFNWGISELFSSPAGQSSLFLQARTPAVTLRTPTLTMPLGTGTTVQARPCPRDAQNPEGGAPLGPQQTGVSGKEAWPAWPPPGPSGPVPATSSEDQGVVEGQEARCSVHPSPSLVAVWVPRSVNPESSKLHPESLQWAFLLSLVCL